MRHHVRTLVSLCLILSAAVVSGCSSADHLLREEHDREVAVLQQRLAEKDQHLEYLALKLQRLKEQRIVPIPIAEARAGSVWTGFSVPALEGTVTGVSGDDCTVVVVANPGNVDIQSIITRTPFRFAVYDENGFKAEAVATSYDAASNVVKCHLTFTKGDATIVVGDKAATKQ
tara:strand:+ start:332 stop:850 length:519 start_codon:yes stop_codon:yes gene_type:complete